jgi:sugar lactone lactonase YvrE
MRIVFGVGYISFKKILFGFVFFCIFSLSFTSLVNATYYTTQINSSTYRNLGTPEGILRLADGSMWYADSANYRIVKISSSGTILRTVGRQGTDEGEFSNLVKSITQDSNGDLYVLDYCKVYKLDSYGGYKMSWGVCGDGDGEFSNALNIHYSAADNNLIVSDTGHGRIIRFDTNGNFIDQFGSQGTGDGEFDEPWGLTTDSNGFIYVVDSRNHRVQVFESDGTYSSQFGSSAPGDFQLVFPKDIEILGNEDLVVTSQNSQVIKVFDSTGTIYQGAWGSSGTADDQFQAPQFMTLDPNDDSIWVTDWGLKRIQHISSLGVFMGIIQNSGSGAGQFINPYSVDFDSSGNMYVLDSGGRVQKFDANGNYTSTLIASGTIAESSIYHIAVNPTSSDLLISTEINVYVYDSSGVFKHTLGNHGVNGANSGNGDFNQARGMGFDSSGNVYVADLWNDRVQKFNSSGDYVTKWTVDYPEYLMIDSDLIYVASPEPQFDDPTPQAVRAFNTSGVLQSTFSSQFGVADTNYWKVNGLAKKDGNLYISDSNNNRLQVYSSDGSFVETIGSTGSGLEQFDGLASAKFNPVTGDLVAVDTNNHRVQIMVSGVKIINLNPSADVINTDDSMSLARRAIDPAAINLDSLTAELYFGDYIVSDFVVDLTQNRDWVSVNTIMLPDDSKSLVVNLNPTDAPGISDTHSLYVVKGAGQNSVRVCTEAVLIADVNSGCVGYVLNEGDAGLSSVNINGTDYWKVTGLTGTGAMGETITPSPTPTSTPNNSIASAQGGSTSNTSSPPACTSGDVASTPDLFQINVLSDRVKLFFTPISNTNTFYFSYSTKPNTLEHGVEATLAKEGVQIYTINLLKPNTTYYFKVRGQNGCKSGEWSNIMQIKTLGKGMSKEVMYYKYNQSRQTLVKSKPLFTEQEVVKVEPQESELSKNINKTLIPSITPEIETKTVTPSEPSQNVLTQKIDSTSQKKCYFWGLWCW